MRFVKGAGWLGLLGLLAISLAGCGFVAAEDTTSNQVSQATIRQLQRLPDAATLVFVVNPSARAESHALRNAEDVVAAAAAPRLTVVGLYEQVGIDDGPPFDRAFVSSVSPSPSGRPPATSSRPCKGTRYQTARCRKAQAGALQSEAAAVRRWRARLDSAVRRWAESTAATIERARRDAATEEAPAGTWNIRAALLRAGQAFDAAGSGRRCLVLLGGLAVRKPPEALPVQSLGPTRIVVAGWQGTDRVQQEWQRALGPAIDVVFLPQSVTELKLVSAVATCLDMRISG